MADVMTNLDRLTEDEAGAYIGGVPGGTLRQWRYRNEGPPFIRLGRLIRYARADLDAWLAAQRVDPSQLGAP